jgi:hypothetical protein
MERMISLVPVQQEGQTILEIQLMPEYLGLIIPVIL